MIPREPIPSLRGGDRHCSTRSPAAGGRQGGWHEGLDDWRTVTARCWRRADRAHLHVHVIGGRGCMATAGPTRPECRHDQFSVAPAAASGQRRGFVTPPNPFSLSIRPCWCSAVAVLLFRVGGLVLVALGLDQSFGAAFPALTEKYFGGISTTIDGIWSGWWGVVFRTVCAGCIVIPADAPTAAQQALAALVCLNIVLMLLAVNGINAGIGFIARDITNALVARQWL